MADQKTGGSESARLEHFDDPELGSGARDTGSDVPEPGGGERPAGTVDEDANPPISDPTKTDVHGGTGELAPQDPGSVIPPYEGRQESEQSAGGSVADPDYKSPSPAQTPGGATKSPADEQPAGQTSESQPSAGGVGPSHEPGTGRGESKS